MCQDPCCDAVPMTKAEAFKIEEKYPIQVKQFVMDVDGQEVTLTKAEILEAMDYRDGDDLPYILRRFNSDDDLLRPLAIKLAKNQKN